MSIFSELIQQVEQKAQPDDSWGCYAIFLRYLDEACQRNLARGGADMDDSDAIFTVEMGHMAQMVATLFAGEGFEEFESYLVTATT